MKKKTVTVRLDSDLVQKARIFCTSRSMKLVDYLDSMVRDQIIRDYNEFITKAKTDR